MDDHTVLVTMTLRGGGKISFTAPSMDQATAFVAQYYPYDKADIVRMGTPAPQDETVQDEAKGALPLSSPPEGFHPSGLPFCDRADDAESEEYAHESAENDPTVLGAENPSNVASVGRKKGTKCPGAEVNPDVALVGRKNQAKPAGLPFCDQRAKAGSEEYAHESATTAPNVPVAENPFNVAPVGRKKGTKCPGAEKPSDVAPVGRKKQAKPGRKKEVKPLG